MDGMIRVIILIDSNLINIIYPLLQITSYTL